MRWKYIQGRRKPGTNHSREGREFLQWLGDVSETSSKGGHWAQTCRGVPGWQEYSGRLGEDLLPGLVCSKSHCLKAEWALRAQGWCAGAVGTRPKTISLLLDSSAILKGRYDTIAWSNCLIQQGAQLRELFADYFSFVANNDIHCTVRCYCSDFITQWLKCFDPSFLILDPVLSKMKSLPRKHLEAALQNSVTTNELYQVNELKL